ncbi:ARI5A protein, partial [Trogon melanurus]|nr:ARI5A protein [Trogon melanurus]
MSPLAKKKLLAQVSKAESLHCHNTPEPPRMPPGPHRHDRRSPEPSGAQDTGLHEVGPNPGVRDAQPCPRAEEGAPAPTVFTGCFRAYRDDALTPAAGCHPLWGYFSSFKDFSEPPSTFPSRAEEPEQPQDLRSKAGLSRRAAVTGCWVPPSATFAPPRSKRGREEEEEETGFRPSNKLRVVSTFGTESDRRDAVAGSPGGQQGVAKPKAVVAGPGYSTPDVYKGEMLRLPVSFSNRVPAVPSLSVSPFVIPAFPSPLVAVSTQPSELCRPLATGPGRFPASYESSLRHRFYPTWQSQPSYAPAFHRPAKL